MEKVPYRPTLFVASKKPTEYKTLDGKFVSPIQQLLNICKAMLIIAIHFHNLNFATSYLITSMRMDLTQFP